MAITSPEKRAGDRFLLAAPGDGWVDREELLREMSRFVMPGKAYRYREVHNRSCANYRGSIDEDGKWPRKSSTHDPLEVGQRLAVGKVLRGAVMYGTWVRDGDRVRHRDHPAARDGV